jgi:hypothetical protein
LKHEKKKYDSKIESRIVVHPVVITKEVWDSRRKRFNFGIIVRLGEKGIKGKGSVGRHREGLGAR